MTKRIQGGLGRVETAVGPEGAEAAVRSSKVVGALVECREAAADDSVALQ